jgi:hypothetical protein
MEEFHAVLVFEQRGINLGQYFCEERSPQTP